MKEGSTERSLKALLRRKRTGYPQPADGRFRTLKTRFAVALLAIAFLTPWLRWSRGDGLPDQAVLFDIPGRRLFLFGLELWPQDLPMAVGVLVLSACGLFLATTLGGRVWCGFACPQTVWTDLFYAVERWSHRISGRDGKDGFLIRNALWGACALVTGYGFIAYFRDAPTLLHELASGAAPSAAYLSVAILAALTWLLAAHARERVCLHMCPWPRLQAAFLDRESLVVTYRSARGEPRGQRPEPTPGEQKAGDCIDCGRCVAVCPTGIDIRDGLQMGCIGCGLCIDACDQIMRNVNRPPGLIAFSAADADPGASSLPAKPSLLRPKTLLFGGATMAAAAAVAVGLATMPVVSIDLEPSRNPPFIKLSDGSVRNDFVIRLAHRLPSLPSVLITVEGLPSAQVRLSSTEANANGAATLKMNTDRTGSDRLLITLPQAEASIKRQPIAICFVDSSTGVTLAKIDSYFWGAGS